METFLLHIFSSIFTLIVVFHGVSFLYAGLFKPRIESYFLLMTHLSLLLFPFVLWGIKFDLVATVDGLKLLKLIMGLSSAFLLSSFLRAYFPASKRATWRIPLIGALLCWLVPLPWPLFVISAFFLLIASLLYWKRDLRTIQWRAFFKIILLWIAILVVYFLPLELPIKQLVIAFLMIPLMMMIYYFINMIRCHYLFDDQPTVGSKN